MKARLSGAGGGGGEVQGESWLDWVGECGENSASCTSLIVGWEGLWTALSYMRQGGYPTTAARQAFGGKKKND